MKNFSNFVIKSTVVVIYIILVITIIDLIKSTINPLYYNSSFDYIDPLLACISIIFSILFFFVTYKLTIFLAQPGIELSEIKHVLKDDQSGYESFAIFKNNSKTEITLKHCIDEKTKSTYQVFLHGLNGKVISVLFDAHQKVVTPGSFVSFKIADVSFNLIESQQFYRLNKKQKYTNIATKENGINIAFSYKDKFSVKKIFVPIYPYNYPKINKPIIEHLPKNDEELKSVYLFLDEELSFVFGDKIYYKLTEEKIEVFQIAPIDNAWNEKRLLSFEEHRDNFPESFLEKMRKFFFTDEEDKGITEYFKKINAIVLEDNSLTLCKSYLNPDLSTGNLMYEYIENSANYITLHKVWQKIILIEKSVENMDKNNKKERIEMNSSENKGSSFNDKLLKFLIVSMVPLSIIGLMSIGVILALILM